MANITTNGEHVPAPELERRGHQPSPGDIYYNKNTHYTAILRIESLNKERSNESVTFYNIKKYNLEDRTWEEKDTVSKNTLDEYYRLLIGDLTDLWETASMVLSGDRSRIEEMLRPHDDSPKTMALVASGPADQVMALTEQSERLQDRLQTINDMMKIQISHLQNQMEAKLSAFKKELSRVKEYVKNLHRIITVMNLYTGANVDIEVICEGRQAPSDEPVTVRQRILFMDEEYLADAENEGIDYHDMDRFCEWLRNEKNRDTVCPEPKCIVAMKPKRYNKNYSSNYYTNQALNRWNHHTIILFRDGERLLMVDSEDLELYETAIPWSDQADRFEKQYNEIISNKNMSQIDLDDLKRRSESLGYMYTKYLSFLQGMVDSGKVFDLSSGRPNFAKEEGVTYVHDAENAITTGESWNAFRKRINDSIRRGTRVVFFPYGYDEYGMQTGCGEPNRKYWHNCSNPAAPAKGVYNVDYPTKTDHFKNEQTGRYEKKTVTLDKLAIFYTPKRWYTDSDRNEAWLYSPSAVLNYDRLTIEDIDRYMADRTQRESFRGWMPILQEARARLVKEKEGEDLFISLMAEELRKALPNAGPEQIRTTVRKAVEWWKNKVIFTRPLTSDDAKAWRMIKKEALRLINKK